MKVDIQISGIAAAASLRERVERRLRLALGSAAGHLRLVTMRLADERSGGADKRCTIRLTLPDATPLTIEQAESDLMLAVDRAADRAARAVARHSTNHAGGLRRMDGGQVPRGAGGGGS